MDRNCSTDGTDLLSVKLQSFDPSMLSGGDKHTFLSPSLVYYRLLRNIIDTPLNKDILLGEFVVPCLTHLRFQ